MSNEYLVTPLETLDYATQPQAHDYHTQPEVDNHPAEGELYEITLFCKIIPNIICTYKYIYSTNILCYRLFQK